MRLVRSALKFAAGASLAASCLLAVPARAQQLCPLAGQAGTCTMAGAPFVPLDPATQPKFVNDLPVPVFYEPNTTTFPGFDYYEVAMQPVTHPGVAFPQPPAGAAAIPAGKQWVGLVDPVTRQPIYTPVWGYAQVNNPAFPLNGVATWPSMSFKATRGRPTKVLWINNAPDQHLLCPDPANSDVPCAIDRTLMGTLVDVAAGERVNPWGGPQQPDNAMVIHLHGGEIPPDSDGMAELWIGNATTSLLYDPAPATACDPISVPAGVTASTDASGATITSWSCGALYSGEYPLANSPGVMADILPHFIPPPGNGIPATYAGLNSTAGPYASGQLIRPTGDRIMYNYPNVQEPATIWYHDHALGKTRINVAAGPAGFYLVRDPTVEAPLYASGALPPEGDCSVGGTLAGNCYDVPVAFQDRAFNTDGTINFPNTLGQAGTVTGNALLPGDRPDLHPQWIPEYFGDIPVINGVAWPRMKVEARPYRFRVLGGSNARCWSVTLKVPGSFAVPPMYVVANEQGYLPAPAPASRLTFCPGERYDVVIDFTNFRNRQVFVNNTAGAPFPNGATPQADPAQAFMANVLRFDVVKPLNPAVPAGAYVATGKSLVPVAPLVATAGLTPRELILNEVTDEAGAPVRVQIDGKAFEDAVTETPKRGSTEVWKFLNTTVDAHPIHLHLVKFQVVSRQRFDSRSYVPAAGIDQLFTAPAGFELTKPPLAPFLLGAPRGPAAIEAGWKDTVVAYPGEVTTVIAHWDGSWNDCPTGATVNVGADGLGGTCKFPAPAGEPYFEPVTSGPYVWHCHIVDHEDNEMMRPSLVMP